MDSLLERKGPHEHGGLEEVRVAFATIDLECVSVPWEVKFEYGVEKALCESAMATGSPTASSTAKRALPQDQETAYEAVVRRS
jgi:hypothetical protein